MTWQARITDYEVADEYRPRVFTTLTFAPLRNIKGEYRDAATGMASIRSRCIPRFRAPAFRFSHRESVMQTLAKCLVGGVFAVASIAAYAGETATDSKGAGDATAATLFAPISYWDPWLEMEFPEFAITCGENAC